MGQSNLQTYQNRAEAVHKYEVVDADGKLDLVGRRFHFIGVGGVGMSGLAKLLIKNKAIVTGSDQSESTVVTSLRQMGADVGIGHHAGHLSSETDAVVISAAIAEDNPELELARTKGCKVYKYAQMLGLVCNRYDGIAIAGTHGKSTTSGWLTFCLRQAGIDANFIVGAEVTQLGSSSGVGDSRYFVAEACEYDRSFLNMRPKIACVLNIEQDHLDYYKDEDEIVDAFCEFARGLRPDGVLIANGQDPNVAKVIGRLGSDVRCETCGLARPTAGGLDENCNFSAHNLRLHDGLYAFDVYRDGELLGPTKISLPGRHNVQNALSVVAVALHTGLPPQQILEVLPDFTGIDRRLTFKGRYRRITVLDDYAHHPTEIRATLEAIRQRYQPGRIWCVFQPHQYSRTRFLLNDFAESFRLADITIVPQIYFVRDSQATKKQVNAQILVERMQANGTEAVFIDGFEAICEYLKTHVANGELVVTMGAGDIWKVADEYIRWLRGNS